MNKKVKKLNIEKSQKSNRKKTKCTFIEERNYHLWCSYKKEKNLNHRLKKKNFFIALL